MNSYSERHDKTDFSKRFWNRAALFFSCCLLMAITAVCFMAPALDKMDKWMDSDIRHQLYVFIGSVTVLGGFMLYRLAKK
jgi:hypothetical protein